MRKLYDEDYLKSIEEFKKGLKVLHEKLHLQYLENKKLQRTIYKLEKEKEKLKREIEKWETKHTD